jgi:hypothetical protein
MAKEKGHQDKQRSTKHTLINKNVDIKVGANDQFLEKPSSGTLKIERLKSYVQMQTSIYEDLPSNVLNIFLNDYMKLYSIFILYVSYTIYYIIFYIA